MNINKINIELNKKMGKTCDACCTTGDDMKKEVIIGIGSQ